MFQKLFIVFVLCICYFMILTQNMDEVLLSYILYYISSSILFCPILVRKDITILLTPVLEDVRFCCSFSFIYIRLTCPCKEDPLTPKFYIVKLEFTGVYIIFLIFALKHRLCVLVRTASLRQK